MRQAVRLSPRFYALAAGDLITKTGDYVYRIAIPVFLLEDTGSAVWAGAAFATQQVGTILAGTLSGPIIDRRNPKDVMLIAVAGMAVLTAFIPLLATNQVVVLVGALVIGLLLEILNFTYRACLNSITPLLVERSLLPNATAVMSVSKFVSKTAGPALAGVLIVLVGPALSLFADAVSFAVLFVLVIFVRLPSETLLRKKNSELHLLQDVKDGLRYILNDRSLVMLNLINFIANLGYVPLLAMFVVHLTGTIGLSAAVVGAIYAVDGLAALLSGLAVPAVMRSTSTGLVIVLSCVGLGAAISALAVLRDPIAIGIAFFAALACAQMVNRVMFTHWQMTVAPEYQARVFGISSALESLATPVAALGAGMAVAAASSSSLFGGCGVIVIIAGLVGLVSSSVRRLDSRERENDPQLQTEGVKSKWRTLSRRSR